MSRSPDLATGARRGDLSRPLRYLYRLPLLILHLLIGLPATLLCLLPPLATVPVGAEILGDRMIRWWSGGLMWIFGMRLRRNGTPLPGAVLFVANHVSWVDIEVMHSQRMMGFVAKREIAGWPVVGWLAARGQTIFHQRGNTESMAGVIEAMEARLREGRAVGVFPEGRTRDGREVGPFHARIFQAAVEAHVPVQPVALCYGAHGRAQTTVAFGPGESFFANFLRLLGEPSREVEVSFLEPVHVDDVVGRRHIADTARMRILEAMAA